MLAIAERRPLNMMVRRKDSGGAEATMLGKIAVGVLIAVLGAAAMLGMAKIDGAVQAGDLANVEHRLELLEERQRLLELWMAQDQVLSEEIRGQLREAKAERKAIWDLLREREER